MKHSLWLSFDLGVRGDYEGIYAWLDRNQARDCGDGLAFLEYKFKGEFLPSLKEAISESVETDKRTRMYVIYLDRISKRMKGKFIFGGRKTPPWAGHSGWLPADDIAEE